MVQGSTNAVIQQGGKGGAGDVVYAVNQTGKELVAGDKVWLNMTTTEDEYSQVLANNTGWDGPLFAFDNVINVNNNQWIWNGSSFIGRQKWTNNSTDDLSDIRSWGVFRKKVHTAWIKFKDGRSVTLVKSNHVLNNRYARNARNLYEYDPNTGKETLIRSDIPDRQILYMPDDSTSFMFVDTGSYNKITIINDILDSSKGQRVFDNLSSEAWPVYFTDGFNDGSYAICVTGPYTNYIDKVIIYKLTADSFVLAQDLPESLQNLQLKTNVAVTYNNATKVLSIADSSTFKIYCYRLIDGKFVEILNIPINLVSTAQNRSFRSVMINNDVDTIAVVYTSQSGGGYTYFPVELHKFNYIDGKWRATTFVECNENTLTGFATGNVNEAGESEISTVLPDTVTLTLNFNIEPDELIFKGEV